MAALRKRAETPRRMRGVFRFLMLTRL